MGLLSSNGTIQKSYAASPEAVAAAIVAVCREQGHHLGTISPDQTRYELNTKRTALNWGTAIVLTLAPAAGGTAVTVDYDNVPNSQKALMDGRKNTKTTEAFLAHLDAAL